MYTVSVALKAKVDQYTQGMAKANVATDSLRKKTEQVRKEQVLMSKAAGIVGTAVVAAFVGKAISAASDLNETLSKTSVVFGDNADAVKAWSKTSATSLGMSRDAAAGAAATYGNLFVSLGLGKKPAADMSMRLVTLAGDLASFNNVDPAEALDALRAGLTGETEPLRRFGVNINDATLRQQALKMGLISTTKDALSPAVKAQASYALILEQTTTAQGDFARTSDGLANQMRILNAQWTDAQAGIGEALLPAAQAAVGVLNTLTGIFNVLPAPIKATALGVVVLGAAFLALAPRIVATKVALTEMGVSSTVARGKLAGLAKGATAVGIAMAAAALVNSFSAATVDAAKNTDELRRSLDALAGSGGGVDRLGRAFTTNTGRAAGFDEALGLVRDNHWWDQLETGLAGVLGTTSNFGMATDAVKALDDQLAAMVSDGHSSDAIAALASLGITADEAAQLLPGYSTAVKNAGDSAAGAVDPTGSLTDALAAQLDPIGKVLDGWNKLDGILGRQDKRDTAIKAIKDMGKAFAENGPVIRGNSDEALANRDAFRQAAGAVEAHLQSIGRGPAALKAYDDEVALLRSTLAKSKLSQAEIDALLKPITDMRDGIKGLTGLAKTPISLNIQPRILGNGQIVMGSQGGRAVLEEIRYRAAGGSVRKGKPYVVGERRPELFVPTQSGRIEPRVPATFASARPAAPTLVINGGGIPLIVQADGKELVSVILGVKRSGGGIELGIA